MSQWEVNPQLDYSATGDDIDTASQKIIQMFNDVYEKLNRLRTMDASASHSVGDAEPFSFKIDTSVNPPALLCRNAAGTGYDQIGLLAENWGIDAQALNLIASDGNIGSIKLGLESNKPASARTYDLYFAYDTGRLYMFLTGAWQVFLSLRFEDLLGVGNVVIKRDEVAPNGANKIPQLNESGQGTFDITGSAAKIGGKNLYLPEIPNGCVLVFNAIRDRWEVAARDDITQDDVSTTGEPNKIVKADANGAIQNDTKGNAAKIAYKAIDVSNLQDGDVLVYDATTGTFKNKQGAVVNAQGVVEANVSGSAQKWAGKAIQTVNMTDGQILVWSESLNAFINRNQSAVGNARALSLRQDGVELANYNGDEYRAVNIITPHLRVGGRAYTEGQTCFSSNMPLTTYLECVTPGVTANVEPDFSTAAIGDVVADGGAEWKVCGYVNSEVTDGLSTRLASEEAITAHDYRQPSTAYVVGNIAYHSALSMQKLVCVQAGTTASGNVTPSTTEGELVTDGTVTWQVDSLADGNYTAIHQNGIAGGRDITAYWESGIMSTNIQSGKFVGMHIGDYIIKTINLPAMTYTDKSGTSVTQDAQTFSNVIWLVGAFDPHLHCGDTETTDHHVLLIPSSTLQRSVSMNPTNDTTGSYIGSDMWTKHMPNWATAIKNTFGSTHVLSHKELLPNATNTTVQGTGGGMTGKSSGWAWTSVDVNIPNETMVYGSSVWGSSYDVGDFPRQLPLYALKCSHLTHRSWFWLRAVASSANFVSADNTGLANSLIASASHLIGGIRPYFLLH